MGVDAAHEKNKDAEAKGVKAHFRMDESGVLYMDKVESVFEKAPPSGGEEESTLSSEYRPITIMLLWSCDLHRPITWFRGQVFHGHVICTSLRCILSYFQGFIDRDYKCQIEH